MENYQILLFDLDGTLSDSKIGITKSVQYALEKLGIIEADLDKLEPFIGPPLRETFARHYRFDEETVAKAIRYYQERYKETGMFENELYPGIPALLKELNEQPYSLVVATSKPAVFAEKILRHFGIADEFAHIIGSNLDGTRSAKADIIAHIMSLYPACGQRDFLMIGDRMHDIHGANHAGIDSVGVAYGYGSVDELTRAGATKIVVDIDGLRELLLSSP